MKRLLHILLIVALCMVWHVPQADARGRNNNGGTNTESPDRHNPSPRTSPGRAHKYNNGNGHHNRQPNSPNVTRPNTRPNNNNEGVSHSRPSHNNGRPAHGNSAPGYGSHNPGPGNVGFGHGRPNNGHHTPGATGNSHLRPRPSHIGNVPHRAPHRPMLPPMRFNPPGPPPHGFRPSPRAPRFGTILGIALGSAITYTIQQLINTGYYVSGYTNNAVYVNDAMMLNMMWPNSTLYYNNGRLAGSEFIYSSPYYDTERYYNTYNALIRDYGAPVATSMLPGGGMTATWYGYDGRYVTLQYSNATAVDGVFRYYTTLSFGN